MGDCERSDISYLCGPKSCRRSICGSRGFVLGLVKFIYKSHNEMPKL